MSLAQNRYSDVNDHKKTPIFSVEDGRSSKMGTTPLFGNPATSYYRPVALRPQVTLGLPLPRSFYVYSLSVQKLLVMCQKE